MVITAEFAGEYASLRTDAGDVQENYSWWVGLSRLEISETEANAGAGNGNFRGQIARHMVLTAANQQAEDGRGRDERSHG